MFIRVEKGSSVPITRQVTDQIRAQCLCGTLQSGERLPAVRELARELAVNVNTVLRAYERLEAEELIEMRHGNGTFVRARPASNVPARQLKAQRDQFSVEFDALIRRGLLLGLHAEDLHRKLDSSLKAAGRCFESSGGASRKTHPSPSLENKS
jgi:GntR family transcriptional regulator